MIKTTDGQLPPKRGRGRPAKPDSLTPAERAKRYRQKVKAKKLLAEEKTVDIEPYDELLTKLVSLRMKYDAEHVQVVLLQNELATLKVSQSAKRREPNPLERKVAALQATVRDQDKIIRGFSAEIAKLRDEIRASQKK